MKIERFNIFICLCLSTYYLQSLFAPNDSGSILVKPGPAGNDMGQVHDLDFSVRPSPVQGK